MSFKILDCTLRDGGYYTSWDFAPELVKTYISSINKLPVDYLEVGYRSMPIDDYRGEYFYCPELVMRALREECDKKIAIMLNEKDVGTDVANVLMDPCQDYIDMVRLAVDPANIKRALCLSEILKKMGYQVAINLMYMSTWNERKDFLPYLAEIGDVADCLCMVDSYGGVYPDELRRVFDLVRSFTDVNIGFHGHNNLELALINSLTAIECGASMVDGTLTGMGRGAGNLKTELLLTALNGRDGIEVDFSSLSVIVDKFSILQREHEWGASLPYMVSGANSLPQKDVMDWITKRFFSLGSIVQALENRTKGLEDNKKLTYFEPAPPISEVLLVGGGPLVKRHEEALQNYLSKRPDITIIHASSRNASVFNGLPNQQIHCLSGNEGRRLESTFCEGLEGDRKMLLAPYPRPMGTYVPSAFKTQAFELKVISFTKEYLDSVTALVLQAALDLGASNVFVVGYDGYRGDISKQQMELFQENNWLFQQFSEHSRIELRTLTLSDYSSLVPTSIYASL